MLQQLVPQEWCLACRRCCRYADAQDAQTPTFALDEVQEAVEKGADPGWFRPIGETKAFGVRLVAHECGGHCPALEFGSHRCTIYSTRPLDCRLYPFVITQDAVGTRTMLAVDTKCPYVQQLGPSAVLRDYGSYLASWLNSPDGQRSLGDNPALADRLRPEFWTMALLDRQAPPVHEAPAPPQGFRPLCDHWDMFETALDQTGRPLSLYHRAAWAPWDGVMRLWWGPIGPRHHGLLAEQAGGFFFALPPLGPLLSADVVQRALTLLDGLNADRLVSRVEGVPESLARACQAWGYRIYGVEREYVYHRQTLESKKRSGAQRLKIEELTVRPYQGGDAERCQRLLALWAMKRQAGTEDEYARAMLRDSFVTHRCWLTQAATLGLVGLVAERRGEVVGYTLGVTLRGDTFVVLAEIADVDDLAHFLAWSLCQRINHPYVNVMGDAGLPSLEHAKVADNPLQVLPVYAVTR